MTTLAWVYIAVGAVEAVAHFGDIPGPHYGGLEAELTELAAVLCGVYMLLGLHRDGVRARFRRPSAYAAPPRGDAEDSHDSSEPREFDCGLLTSSLRTVHTDLSKGRFLETKFGEPVSRSIPMASATRYEPATASDRER